jgi:hypothetical protein
MSQAVDPFVSGQSLNSQLARRHDPILLATRSQLKATEFKLIRELSVATGSHLDLHFKWCRMRGAAVKACRKIPSHYHCDYVRR